MGTQLRAEDLQSCLSHPHTAIETTRGLIEYADRGRGTPLLAVHGTLGGWDQGLVAAEYFRANGFRLIAPSRPGYLGTPLDTGRTAVEQADALAALLDGVGIENTCVFGGSGGGPAAYPLAARHPDRVDQLLQVDSVCLPLPRFRFARLASRDAALSLNRWLLHRHPRFMLGMLFQRFGQASRAQARVNAHVVAEDPVRLAHLDAILAASTGWKSRRAGFDNDSAGFRSTQALQLEDIKCPTLIMHARGDAGVPPENATHAHRLIEGSELYWMRGSHVAFFIEEGGTAPEYALTWLQAANPPGRRRGSLS